MTNKTQARQAERSKSLLQSILGKALSLPKQGGVGGSQEPFTLLLPPRGKGLPQQYLGLAPTSSCPCPCKGTHHFTGIADHQEMSSLCPAGFLAGIPVFLLLEEGVTPASVGHPLLRAAWTWTA